MKCICVFVKYTNKTTINFSNKTIYILNKVCYNKIKKER